MLRNSHSDEPGLLCLLLRSIFKILWQLAPLIVLIVSLLANLFTEKTGVDVVDRFLAKVRRFFKRKQQPKSVKNESNDDIECKDGVCKIKKKNKTEVVSLVSANAEAVTENTTTALSVPQWQCTQPIGCIPIDLRKKHLRMKNSLFITPDNSADHGDEERSFFPHSLRSQLDLNCEDLNECQYDPMRGGRIPCDQDESIFESNFTNMSKYNEEDSLPKTYFNSNTYSTSSLKTMTCPMFLAKYRLPRPGMFTRPTTGKSV